MTLIILWILVFSLVHSFTADKRVKQWVSNKFGERLYYGWYRLVYNIKSVVMLAPLFLYMWTVSEPIYLLDGFVAVILRVLQVIGLFGIAISILQIDALRFAGLRQLIAYYRGDTLPLTNEPLTTDGLYGFVRHPLYFFSLMLLWFSPTMTTSSFFFNLGATLYFVFGSLIEERRMLAGFGQEYADYQKNVSWLIPLPKRQVEQTSL